MLTLWLLASKGAAQIAEVDASGGFPSDSESLDDKDDILQEEVRYIQQDLYASDVGDIAEKGMELFVAQEFLPAVRQLCELTFIVRKHHQCFCFRLHIGKLF